MTICADRVREVLRCTFYESKIFFPSLNYTHFELAALLKEDKLSPNCIAEVTLTVTWFRYMYGLPVYISMRTLSVITSGRLLVGKHRLGPCF